MCLYFFFSRWNVGVCADPEDPAGFEAEQVGRAVLVNPGDEGRDAEGTDTPVEGVCLAELAHPVGEFLDIRHADRDRQIAGRVMREAGSPYFDRDRVVVVLLVGSRLCCSPMSQLSSISQ